MATDLQGIWRYVDERRDDFVALSDAVWSSPELCYAETRSAARHAALLEQHGFRVTHGVAGIPTALMGEAGEGGSVVAILGEYDALPGLSQESGVAEPRPVEAGGNGHGCGHNLLGAGAMLAAVALKDWLADHGLPGRVRYYGCPAEEGGAGKTFMVREGAFAGVEAAISWHPSCFCEVVPAASLANTRIDFTFTGRAAHAAAAPHLGRSALDAVELMNVGVNYMREHMPSDARIHYAVLDAGGIAPNVVQARAKVRYAVRAPDLPGMQDLVDRVRKVGQGAALMTETSVEAHIISAVSNLLGNDPLESAMYDVLQELGPPPFDGADQSFAKQIRATLPDQDVDAVYRIIGQPRDDAALCERIVPRDSPRQLLPISTDVGDVSWAIPTVQVHGAVMAIGTPFHSWQLVAQGKMPAAHKGMIHAAKVMAATAGTILSDPALLAAAKADHAGRTTRTPYRCPIPVGTSPPLDMAVGKSGLSR